MLKICLRCNIEKLIDDYHKSGKGHCSKCKDCRNELNRIYKADNRDKINGYNKYYNSTEKAKIQKKKWSSQNREYYTQYYINNIDVLTEYQKKWYNENREEVISRVREYYKLNSEKVKENSMKYYYSVKNSEKFKERNRNYMKKRYKEVPHVFAWRGILRNSLRYLDTDKESKTIEMLKYSCSDLKMHMESLFQEGMSWNNWGEWHIDHIYPLSKFDKGTPPHIVNELSNLQPLWAIDNIKKGNKLDG